MEPASREEMVEAACEQLGRLFDAGDREALISTIRQLLSAALEDNERQRVRVAELLRTLYGRSSERFNPAQLCFGFLSVVPESPAESEPSPATPVEGAARKPARRRTGHRGSRSLPAHLPREEIRLQPTEEQLAATGGQMRKWREERSEVLEYVPAKLKVLVYVREVWSNAYGEVVTAPAPVKLIAKGLPGPGLVVQVVLSKYRDKCPLTRQVDIFRRLGAELSRNTLVDWVAAAADLLRPLARAIFRLVMAAYVLQVDDTKLPVLDRRKAKNIKKGHIWALVGDRRYVAYRYTENWRRDQAFKLLRGRKGWMQVDAYKGYQCVFALGLAIEVGCLMHARRYFVRAFEGKDLRAAAPLELIGKMYRIEAASKAAGEWPHELLLRRQRETKPLFDAWRLWLDEHAGRIPPKSPLGKAITYANNHWEALTRPLQDGNLALDNGEAERALRGLAMGRRNWLFAGSDEGAERTAILCTVIESAARHGLDLRLYLQDVLLKLASGWPPERLDELLPHRWRPPPADAARATELAATQPSRAAA
jgi:transposase